MRRDYGAAPKGAALSKIDERRMREQGAQPCSDAMALSHLPALEDQSSQEFDENRDR